MREIKFRGREYDARYGLHWVYGDLTHKFVQVLVAGCIVEEATVGQFTGLKDADGREIYEGDVVRTDDWSTPSYIRWDGATASFVVDRWSVNLAHVSQIKVIGNVHDSPELLEGKDA